MSVSAWLWALAALVASVFTVLSMRSARESARQAKRMEKLLFRTAVTDISGHPVLGGHPGTEESWVWLGACAGFQILPEMHVPTPPAYGKPAYGQLHLLLIHRCGWEHRVEFLGDESYVGNLISGPLVTHRVEGCRTP